MLASLARGPSLHARQVDALFGSLLAFALGMTLIMGTLIVYFLVRYRKGSPASRANRAARDVRLDFTWTGAAILIALGLFAWSAKLYIDRNRPPTGALQITAVGKQWMWKVQHPGGQREINSLHVPADRPVSVELASQDVIHSFFIPAFRIKQDAVPGRATRLWFTATQTGRFPLYCAEYCGTEHSGMRGEVIVMEPQEYAAWLANQPQAATLAGEGARLYAALGCSGCHEAGGPVRAPQLAGLYLRPVGLSDGRVVIADRQYVWDSIMRPGRDVVAGFDPVMPDYGGLIDDTEVMALIAFIQSLSEESQ